MPKNTKPEPQTFDYTKPAILDYFAAAALIGLIQVEMNEYQNEAAMQITARKAYELAEMMLEERKKLRLK